MPVGSPPSLLQDLRDPAAYPPPRPSSVELRATHLSWVFLTDTEAWKLKRPVDYGFADYSTLERREHFCREELRLNRRLAPDVYLGVEPLRRDAQGLSFSRPGETVDHAVRMRRLPDDASAAARLAEGRLSFDDLDRLAAMLAEFYRSAEVDRGSDATGLLRRNLAENFEQTRPFVGRLIGRDDHDLVRERQEGFVERHRDLFARRAAGGRIRDGHGDLRLEHVYFLGERPVAIDAIEFNRRFRVADVALDAAFLAMELEARGASRLAEGFMARFALASNDYDFYPLLDFYLGYRAWVRAKVACFVAADPSTEPDKKRRKADEAAALVALARYFSGPRRAAPALVVVGGLIGSGKSTLAAALARAKGWPLVASDLTRKHLAGIEALEPGGPDIYSPEYSRWVYREMFRRAGQVLDSGRSVLLDATFLRRESRLDARAVAESRHVPFFFIETWSPGEVLRERLLARALSPSVSDARESLLEDLRRDAEPVTELPLGEYARLDSTLPVADLVRQAGTLIPG